jgi:hypothetical protein
MDLNLSYREQPVVSNLLWDSYVRFGAFAICHQRG